MPNETVTLTLSGANGPITRSLTINVDVASRTGNTTFNWTGSKFGLDYISAAATVTGRSLTSNVAQARFGYADINCSISGEQGTSSSTYYTFVVIGYFADGTNTGPSKAATAHATHFYVNWTSVPGVSYYKVFCTQLNKGDASTLTVRHIGAVHGVGNTSRTDEGGGPNYPATTTRLWMDNGDWFPYDGDGTTPPATNTTLASPSLGAASGDLTVTPTGSAAVVGSSQSVTVTLSNIIYTSIPYVPVYEDVAGTIPLYNSSSTSTFTYPTYNGQAVDKSAAATKAWSMSGDNTSWQGRTSVVYDANSGKFNLSYSGAAIDTHVDTTTLTLSANDIAWYNSAAKTFDVFPVSNLKGGVSAQVVINWWVKAAIGSVTLDSAVADGKPHVFTVTLKKPISPRQMGTQYGTGNTFSASFSAVGATVTNTTPVFDSSGWLTGWKVTATIPLSTSSTTVTLNANIGGTLTYLNGSTFTTNGNVSYVNGTIGTFNVTGSAATPPQAYSFSVIPVGPVFSSSTGTITLTGVVFQQQNNAITLNFVGVNKSNSVQYSITTGTQTNRQTSTFNGQSGWLTTFTGTMSYTSVPPSPGATLGFVATDSSSGLSVTYLSSTVYSQYTSTGGGGGGGCFTAAVAVRTTNGLVELGSLPTGRAFEIVNQTGAHMAELLVHENYAGWMLKLAPGKFVTLDHLMKLSAEGDEWVRAEYKYTDLERVWFEGTVYNLHVLSSDPQDQHFVLFNGDVAHNNKAPNDYSNL